jgi:hypothetical protein
MTLPGFRLRNTDKNQTLDMRIPNPLFRALCPLDGNHLGSALWVNIRKKKRKQQRKAAAYFMME